MKRVLIIGGETHIGEITALRGDKLEIVGAAVREDQLEWAREQFECEVGTDYVAMLDALKPDIAAIANANDLKAQAVLLCLQRGVDVIVDKPLALNMAEQEAVEQALGEGCYLLHLLTLRGNPQYRGLQQLVSGGRIGKPVFCHVRMAVQLKPEARPAWFLDYRRSGGLFLDLLIHGLDQVEWCTGQRIVAMTAVTGNLSRPQEQWLHDHASVFCELDDGSTALVEGQRLLPATKGSDYRMQVVGTEGVADLVMGEALTVTDPSGADTAIEDLPEAVSVVADWLNCGNLVPAAASLRANRLAVLATVAAQWRERVTEGL